MTNFNIQPLSSSLKSELQKKIDQKTKPLGALGELESVALKIGCVQHTLTPQLNNPTFIVFAADHGIAHEKVSAYPQEVTYQMVYNFLSNGAAINVFCRQNNIALQIVDAGVNHDFPSEANLISAKIAYGTENFLHTPAMNSEQCRSAIAKGNKITSSVLDKGCNIIGFGEMGIGNTSSASLLMHKLTGIELQKCVGKGTGITDRALTQKYTILQNAVDAHNVSADNPEEILQTFGGFEIAMIVGGILKSAERGAIILIDGFIATSALLTAYKINPNVIDYCFFCHQSNESGHTELLKYLQVNPLIDLNMRLGEGTGAAVSYPIIKSAVTFLNEMASFEGAGVSGKN